MVTGPLPPAWKTVRPQAPGQVSPSRFPTAPSSPEAFLSRPTFHARELLLGKRGCRPWAGRRARCLGRRRQLPSSQTYHGTELIMVWVGATHPTTGDLDPWGGGVLREQVPEEGLGRQCGRPLSPETPGPAEAQPPTDPRALVAAAQGWWVPAPPGVLASPAAAPLGRAALGSGRPPGGCFWKAEVSPVFAGRLRAALSRSSAATHASEKSLLRVQLSGTPPRATRLCRGRPRPEGHLGRVQRAGVHPRGVVSQP